VLVLIVLLAIDFARAYTGWVAVNSMARVGAYYAATHPDAWPDDLAAQAEYESLMRDNTNMGMPCVLNDPIFEGSKDIGQHVRVEVTCDYPIITPIVASIVGGAVDISGSSTFPISYGCIGVCPPPPAETTPPPPPEYCRVVPDLVDLSITGARSAWVTAGFLADNFTAPDDAEEWRTVADQTLTLPPDSEFCEAGKVFFGAQVEVTVADLEPPSTGTCLPVPNVVGFTIASARSTWTSIGFTGLFTPEAGLDDLIVIQQTTTPSAPPGACAEPDLTIAVVGDEPPPPPPEAPCKVPSFVNTHSDSAMGSWQVAGFSGTLSFVQPNRLPYTIKSQSLVGGTWVSCSSSITLSWR
jgi:hypothetical protein